MNNRFMRDCLANLASTNNNSDRIEKNRDYYRGLIVGMVSLGMDRYKTNQFEKSVKLICDNLPWDCIPLGKILPECWQEEFKKHMVF